MLYPVELTEEVTGAKRQICAVLSPLQGVRVATYTCLAKRPERTPEKARLSRPSVETLPADNIAGFLPPCRALPSVVQKVELIKLLVAGLEPAT